MKKYLAIFLILLLVLTGCTQNQNQPANNESNTENTEQTEVVEEPVETDVEKTVLVSVGPEVRLHYNKDLKVTEAEPLGDDAITFIQDLQINGTTIKDAVNLLIDTANNAELIGDGSKLSITIESTDEKVKEQLSELVNDVVNNSEKAISASLQERDGETVNEVVSLEKEVKKEMPSGIYVSDEWVNPTASRWPDTKDVVAIVFLDDGRGYICSYDLNRPTAGRIPIAFSWDESGNIAYYMTSDDYTYKLASGGNGRTATFEYKDGVLTEYLSDNEYITYHHVDSYSAPGYDPYALYEVYYQDLEADYNTCIEARHNNYKLIGQ